jgi:hypothetical protein
MPNRDLNPIGMRKKAIITLVAANKKDAKSCKDT